MNKKFSIVMPCYKDAYKTMGRAIFSIQDQNYQDWELIVVFDGKKENELGIAQFKKGFKLETLGKKHIVKPLKDKRIKYFVKEWGGTTRARNFGVSKSDGDYITLIDPDVYLYAGTLREWADAFDEYPEAAFVYGTYDIVGGYQISTLEPFNRYVLQSFNYLSGANPIRREFWKDQTPGLKSLQDWDMWLSITKDGAKGQCISTVNPANGQSIPKSFFITEQPGKTSEYSNKHWLELVKSIKKRQGISINDLAVCSFGAEHHAINAAEILGADVLLMNTIHKPNDYKAIYLLGFYPGGAKHHWGVFAKDWNAWMAGQSTEMKKIKKIIHWIGTDVLQMHKNVCFDAMKGIKTLFKKFKIVNLTECQQTHDELAEVGIKSEIVPTIPSKLYEHNQFPQPKKFTVANYINPTQREMYLEEFVTLVAKAMPDVDFVFFGDKSRAGYVSDNIEYIGWQPMDEVIKRSSCLIRMVAHDGLPHGPIQFLSAGRKVISNYKFKHFEYSDAVKKDLIEAIRKVQKDPVAPKVAGDYWKKVLDKDDYRKTIRDLAKS